MVSPEGPLPPLRMRPGGQLGRRIGPPRSARVRRLRLRLKIAGELATLFLMLAFAVAMVFVVESARFPRHEGPYHGWHESVFVTQPERVKGAPIDEFERLELELGGLHGEDWIEAPIHWPEDREAGSRMVEELESIHAEIQADAEATGRRYREGAYGTPGELETIDRTRKAWEGADRRHRAAVQRFAKRLGVDVEAPMPRDLRHGMNRLFPRFLEFPGLLESAWILSVGNADVIRALEDCRIEIEVAIAEFADFCGTLP